MVVWPSVGQQAEAGRRVSGVPRAPLPGQVVPKLWGLALGAVSTRVPGRVCGVGGIEYLPGGPSHSCHVL